MAEPNTYYQPTEYEELLLAAGWLSMADLDDDYQEYARWDDEPMSYSQWTHMKREWDKLNEEYEREIEPYYTGHSRGEPLPQEVEEKQKLLLDNMMHYESALGY